MRSFQLQTIKAQLLCFMQLGCVGNIITNNNKPIYEEEMAHVILLVYSKMYRFSDPDLNVIISQLAELYKNIKARSKTRELETKESRD